MKSFEFLIPTKIVFGRGKIETLNNEIDNNILRILIVTDKDSGEKSGALKAIKAQLKDRFLKFTIVLRRIPHFSCLRMAEGLLVQAIFR